MNGSGTQADPYLITTCQEFFTFITTLSGYAELTKNLDCNEDGFLEWNMTGQPSVNAHKEIDFKGHYLANVFIPEDGYFYYGYYNRKILTCKNGAIINVYEQGAKGFTRDAKFFNFALDIRANTFTQPIIFGWGSGTIFDYCNVRIKNINANNVSHWFEVENNHYFATNSKFTLNGSLGNGSTGDCLLESSANASGGGCAFKNCLIEGKLTDGGTDAICKKGSSTDICVGTIWKVDLKECNCSCIWGGNSNTVNIIDSELIGNQTMGSDMVSLTDAQIRSHNKLDEIGFDTVEVID